MNKINPIHILPSYYLRSTVVLSSYTFLHGPGSMVTIATGYGLDSPGIESRWGQYFLHLSRPALGPTQPPVGFFPEVKSSWGVTLTPHPLLMPWSRKGRAIPLLPLRAIRPVQSLSACTRVHFTLPFIYSFQVVCFLQVSPPKPCMNFFPMHTTHLIHQLFPYENPNNTC